MRDIERREILRENPPGPKALKPSWVKAMERQRKWDENPDNWRRFVQREGQGMEALPRRRIKKYPKTG
jgi:hypothetical protein